MLTAAGCSYNPLSPLFYLQNQFDYLQGYLTLIFHKSSLMLFPLHILILVTKKYKQIFCRIKIINQLCLKDNRKGKQKDKRKGKSKDNANNYQTIQTQRPLRF